MGYVPLAELWDRYRAKRLRDFYTLAANHYLEEGFQSDFVRGSPLDICEQIFLKSVSDTCLFLAAPEGRVHRIHAPMDESRASLCSVRAVYSSALRWAAHQIEADEKLGGVTVEARGFHPWHSDREDAGAWSILYPPLADNQNAWPNRERTLKFHCLPLCFERPRYTVAKTLPPWSVDIRHKDELLLLVESFGGWAICMAEADVAAWQPYLEGKGVYADEPRISCRLASGGRPGLQEAAREDYEATFPGGRNTPWKLVPDRIRDLTGRYYSESTIRRAIARRGDD